MAIQRSRLFTGGDQGPQDPSSYSVQIDSPADDILKQKDAVLTGWRAKTQKEKQYAAERLNALEQNYRIEQDYRKNAFKLELADNKLVADAILKNYETEVEKINNRAESAKIKSDAIQSIIGTVSGVAARQHQKALAEEKKKADSAALEAGVDGSYLAEIDYLSDPTPYQKQVDGKSIIDRELARSKGLDPLWIESVIDFNGREKRALVDLLRQKSAENIGAQYLPKAVREERIITNYHDPGGVKITYKEAEHIAQSLGPQKREVYLAQAGRELLQGYSRKEAFKENRYARDHENLYLTKSRLEFNTKLRPKVQASSRSKEWGIQWSRIGELTQGGAMDHTAAFSQVAQEYLNIKVPGQTQKQRMASFNNLIELGLRSGEITPDQYSFYSKASVKSRDKIDKNGKPKTVTLQEQFPNAGWASLESTAREVKLADDAKWAKIRDQQKEAEKAQIARYEDLVETGTPEENSSAAHKERFLDAMSKGQYDLAKHIMGKYISGPGSAPVTMEKMYEEQIAHYKLYEPHKYNKKYILGLKNVRDSWKQEKLTALEEGGDFWPTDKDTKDYLKEGADNIRRTVEGEKAYGDFGFFIGANSVKDAGNDAVDDYQRRVRAALNHKSIPDNATVEERWQLARGIAEAQFEADWKAGEEGKGKFAKSKLPGKITYPYYFKTNQDQYNGPDRYLRFKLGYKSMGIKYLTDARAKIVQDDRLEEIHAGNGSYPRIIYEIKKSLPDKADGSKYTERDVMELLYQGYNARNPDKPPLSLNKLSTKEEALGDQASLYPGVITWPYDRSGIDIVRIGASLGNRWDTATIGNGLNPLLAEVV